MRFGTVGSPKSTPAKPGGSVGAVRQIAELGLDALELGWVQSVRVSEETCSTIKQTSQETGVAISVHAPYFINLNADETEWPKSRKRLWDAAFYGNLAGATDIVFHPGSYFTCPPEEVLTGGYPKTEGSSDRIARQRNQGESPPRDNGETGHAGVVGRYAGNEQIHRGCFSLCGFCSLVCPFGRWKTK